MSSAVILSIEVVSWLSFALAASAFAGYPLLMVVAVAARAKQRSQIRAGAQPPRPQGLDALKPKVAIIVAAHNEESAISATLVSLLAQDYPADRRRIVVFSDGSTDATASVVGSFAGRGVELIEYDHLGKTECQNRTVATLSPDVEVVAFCDGNVRWEPQALSALVLPLREDFAATTGKLLLERTAGREEREHEGLFRRVDESIKAGEDALASTIGVNGPIYAVRRREYITLRADLVSDLVLPVLLVARGRRVAYVPQAIARERASESVGVEFGRKRRLVTQGLVALPLLLRAGWRSRTPGLLAMLTLHKFARWFGFELLVLFAGLQAVLLPRPTAVTVVAASLLALAGALVALAQALRGRSAGPLMPFGYFLLTTFAGLLGKLDLLRGRRAATWSTARSKKSATPAPVAAPAAAPTPVPHDPSQPTLSIVIVTYQSRSDIGACLTSLQQFAPAFPYQVFVVDNASTDGTADYVASSFPAVTLIRSATNEGFSRGNNRAIDRARGRYVLALNPDARVTAGALDALVHVADSVPTLGTLAPKLVFPDGRSQPNTYWFPAFGPGLAQLLFLEKVLERQARRARLTTAEWSFGAALLFPRVIDGRPVRFDPEIFLYSEDIELCWRLHKLGRTNYATAAATIVHALNRSGQQAYGNGSARFAEWKKTLRYVTEKHWKGILKGQRFWLYCQLRAVLALERALVVHFRKLPRERRQQLRAEHLALARAFVKS